MLSETTTAAVSKIGIQADRQIDPLILSLIGAWLIPPLFLSANQTGRLISTQEERARTALSACLLKKCDRPPAFVQLSFLSGQA